MTEEVKKAFQEWKDDNSAVEAASKYEFVGSKVLIRLFYFDPPKKDSSLIIGGDAATGLIGIQSDKAKDVEVRSGFKLFPIAKILAVGNGVTGEYSKLKPGDIAVVMDDIKGTHLNPKWLDYMEKGGPNARPKITSAPPPQFIGNLAQWARDIFALDKFKAKYDTEDMMTFLLPQNFILSKYKD